MINLVPPEGRNAVVRRYRMALGTIACTFLALILAVNIALLAPSYISLMARSQALEIEQENAEAQLDTEAVSEAQKAIVATTKRMAALREDPDLIRVGDLFKKVAATQSPAIRITAIYFNGEEGRAIGKNTIIVKGIADSRRELIGFSERLEGESLFEKAEVPVSDLLRDEDVPFTITISGEF